MRKGRLQLQLRRRRSYILSARVVQTRSRLVLAENIYPRYVRSAQTWTYRRVVSSCNLQSYLRVALIHKNSFVQIRPPVSRLCDRLVEIRRFATIGIYFYVLPRRAPKTRVFQNLLSRYTHTLRRMLTRNNT